MLWDDIVALLHLRHPKPEGEADTCKRAKTRKLLENEFGATGFSQFKACPISGFLNVNGFSYHLGQFELCFLTPSSDPD